MNLKPGSLLVFIVIIFLYGCRLDGWQNVERLSYLNDSIRNIYAPDKRVKVYDVTIQYDQKSIQVTGESSDILAIQKLESVLKKEFQSIDNQINILPDTSVGETIYAVVNNSVCNIRSDSRHSSELATQAILGMTLRVLKKTEEWYLIQSPDGYISWVDHGGVQLMNDKDQSQWSESPKVIYMLNQGQVYSDSMELTVLSDIVLGARLVIVEVGNNHVEVKFPDGRVGFVRQSEVKGFDEWKANLNPSGELLVAYAQNLLGSPYLWGGTSTKGMDCSGFTKIAYMMNGLTIPRDASQQVMVGSVIDENLKFEGLEKGDLVFFGKAQTDTTKRRVTHVGIWIGDDEFVHSSQRVRISSIDSASTYYDEFNKNRYLGARRYLGVIEKPIR